MMSYSLILLYDAHNPVILLVVVPSILGLGSMGNVYKVL